jgi:hypothetical protein
MTFKDDLGETLLAKAGSPFRAEIAGWPVGKGLTQPPQDLDSQKCAPDEAPEAALQGEWREESRPAETRAAQLQSTAERH